MGQTLGPARRNEAMSNLRNLLKISAERLQEVNDMLTDPANESVGRILEIVEKYGGPEEINRKAVEARNFDNLMARLKEMNSPYAAEVRGGQFPEAEHCYNMIAGEEDKFLKLIKK